MRQSNEITRVTGTSQVVVATGSGVLENIIVNTMGGTTTITISDKSFSLTGSAIPQAYQYNCRFNGTLAVTCASAGGDIAVVWSR